MAKPITTNTNITTLDSVPEEPNLLQKPPFEVSSNEFDEYSYQDVLSRSNTPSGRDEFSEITRKILEKSKIGQKGEVFLKGKYPENKVYFPLYDLDNITPVSDININFVLKVNSYLKSKQGVGTRYKLFTSSKIYEYLVNAYNRNLPYPALSKLVDVVEIDLKTLTDFVKKQKPEEEAVNVEINNNIGIKFNKDRGDYEIDYDVLLKYIDWVVSKPGLNYEERLIPVNEISDVQIVEEEDVEATSEDNTESDQGGTSQTNNQDPNPNINPNSPNAPVGRAGNYFGEIVSLPSGNYFWDGNQWILQGGSGNQSGNNGTSEPGGNDLGPNGNVGGSGNPSGGAPGSGRPGEILQ